MARAGEIDACHAGKVQQHGLIAGNTGMAAYHGLGGGETHWSAEMKQHDLAAGPFQNFIFFI